jgi:hypothetical protein
MLSILGNSYLVFEDIRAAHTLLMSNEHNFVPGMIFM